MPEFRAANTEDIPALHSLIERAYRGDSARGGWTHEADLLGGQRTDTESLSAILHDPKQEILICSDGEGITGCVQVSNRGDGLCYLGLLAVDPGHQAAGLGRRLIEIAEKHAAHEQQANCMEMTVIAQRPELIAYYERRGYRVTGEQRPFPMHDVRFGMPTTNELVFEVLMKCLQPIV